ncbi:hypothetical protein KKA01_00790 [Patescibacteria group bacterium]|nr:hypothetical protein [Patescibacteria group bacterium]
MSGARPIEWVNDQLKLILDLPNRLRTRRKEIGPEILSLIGTLFDTSDPYFTLKSLLEEPIILGKKPEVSEHLTILSRKIDESLNWVNPSVRITYATPAEIAGLIDQEKVRRLSCLHTGVPDPIVVEWLQQNGERPEWRKLCQLCNNAAHSLTWEICENYNLDPRCRFLLNDLFRKLIIYHIQVVGLKLKHVNFGRFIGIICGMNFNDGQGMIPLGWSRECSDLVVLCRPQFTD